MRRINIKVLLITIVGFGTLAGMVHLVHKLQSKRSASALLRQADRAMEKGDDAKALQYLERYLAYVPSDTVALTRYGRMLTPSNPTSEPRAGQRAAGVLEKVLVRDPANHEVRRELAELQMKVANNSAALTHWEILLDSHRDDGFLELMRGECLERLDRFEEAAEWYDKARQHKPDLIDAFVRLAILKRQRLTDAPEADRIKEADRIMDAVTIKDGLISANGKSFRAFLERAKYRRFYGLDGWKEDTAQALVLAPDEADVILASAQMALLSQPPEIDRARTLLTRGLELHPKLSVMYEMLASVEQDTGHYEAAAACYKRAVEALPEQADFRWRLADTLITANDLSGANKVFQELQKTKVSPEPLGYINARLLYSERKWSEAARILEDVTPTLANQPESAWLGKLAYLLLGQCYERLNLVDRQYTAYRRAVDIVAGGGAFNLRARIGLAASLTARNRIDEAIDEYRKILALPGARPETRIDLARLLIRREIGVPAAQRRWVDAQRALDDAEKGLPGSSEVVALRGEILLAEGQVEKAIELIRLARERTPDSVALWVNQALLEARQGRNEESLRLIDAAEKRLGPRPELRVARAQYWARRGGPEAVTALTALEASAAELSREDQMRFLRTLSEQYAIAKSPERSRSLRQRIALEDPTDLPVRIALFDQSLVDGDETSAKKYLAEIERLDVEGALTIYGRVLLLIRRSDQIAKTSITEARSLLADASRLLAEAAKLRPDWANLPLTEAQIKERETQPEAALAFYLRAIELGERGPVAILRATDLLYKSGKFAQADQLLQKLPNQGVLTSDQQRMAAELALRSQDFDRAMKQARAALAAAPKDYRNSIELANIQYLEGRKATAEGRASAAEGFYAETERSLRNAVELDKEAPSTHMALVRFLTEIGQKARAKEAIKEARRLLPPKVAPLALAQYLAIAGEPAETQEAFRIALAASPDDPATLRAVAAYSLATGRIKEAEDFLRRIAGLKNVPPDDATWARTTLALLMASSSDARRATEALKLLDKPDGTDQARSGGIKSVQDRRAKAIVLSLQTSRERRDEAIGLFEGILQEGSGSPDDRFILAQLYEFAGNWSKAREQLQILMDLEASDPRFGIYYTLNLLKHGQLSEAQFLVTQLEKARPDSPTTVELKARVLHALGRKSDALALIAAFVRDKNAQLVPFAGVLDILKEHDEAEKLLRRAIEVDRKPSSTFALIRFLARRGRTKEALKLCDAAWSPTTAGDVANAYIQTLAVAKTLDKDDMNRIATRFETQIKAHPDNLALLLHLANLRTFQGQYSEAEAIFKSLADRQKGSAVPLNNLAWLYALEKGQENKALPLITKAIEIQGEAPNVLDTRALAYIALGRGDDAIHDMENAIVRSPVANKYFHLARAYLIAGRREDAIQALQKAMELGLTEADIHPLERPAFNNLVTDLAKK